MKNLRKIHNTLTGQRTNESNRQEESGQSDQNKVFFSPEN
jgi:hypothetical protein